MARAFRYEWEGAVRRLALPRGVKHVAAVLAQYADPDGRKVRPGLPRLAEETGYSDKQVRRHLKVLRDLGLIHRVRSGSANGRRALADEYVLRLPDDILDRVDLVKPVNVDAMDNSSSTGHQMTDDESKESPVEGKDHRTSDDQCSTGTPDIPIPEHRTSDDHPPSMTTPAPTFTPKDSVVTEGRPATSREERAVDKCDHGFVRRLRPDGSSSCALCRRGLRGPDLADVIPIDRGRTA